MHAHTHTHTQVDTIDPKPGITVREAGRTITGPKSHNPPGLVSPRANMHLISPLDDVGSCARDRDFSACVVSSTPLHGNLDTTVTESVGKHVCITAEVTS